MSATPTTPSATARMVAMESRARLRPALLPGDALEDGQATAGAVFSEGQEDAGEDEGAEKGEQAAADPGDEAERGAGKIADLRLHALHEGGQIVVRPAPQSVEFPANERPGGKRLGRRRDPQCVLLHGLDQGADGIAQRTHQHADGHDERDDPEQHQQGRGEPGPPPKMGSHAQVQRVKDHRKNKSPDRERKEGGENAIAEQRHPEKKGRADQNLEEAAREAPFEILVGRGERRHERPAGRIGQNHMLS